MGKLNDIQSMVAEMFNKASDKTQIDQLATLNNLVGEAVAEQEQLEKKNAEIVQDYKKLVSSVSFKEAPQELPGNEKPIEPPVLEDYFK